MKNLLRDIVEELQFRNFYVIKPIIHFLLVIVLIALIASILNPGLLKFYFFILLLLYFSDRFLYKKFELKFIQKAFKRGVYFQELVSLWNLVSYWNRKLLSYFVTGLGLFIVIVYQFAPITRPGTFIFLGFFFVIIGQRIGALDGRRLLLQKKNEKPVLYLRSFEVDEYDENQNKSWFIKKVYRGKEEHILASIFEPIGPFIAVGKPGELLPNIGAARIYFDDNKWQKEVINLMKKSSIVLLRVGDSAGFQWELQQALSNVELQNILIYFSKNMNEDYLRKSYVAVKNILKKEIKIDLTDEIHNERIIFFDTDDKPILTGKLDSEYKESFAEGCILPFLFIGFRRFIKNSIEQRRLGGVMREFFNQRGRKLYDRSIFGYPEIFFGTYISPIAGGLMLLRNLMVDGKKVLGITVFLFLSIFNVMIEYFVYRPLYDELTFSQQLSAPAIDIGIYFILALIVIVLWKKFSSQKIRLHLALGGKKISFGITLAVILLTIFILDFQMLFTYLGI